VRNTASIFAHKIIHRFAAILKRLTGQAIAKNNENGSKERR